MKKVLLPVIRVVSLLVFILVFSLANAQIRYAPLAEQDFTISLQNMTQPTPKTLEFDVYLLDTDPAQPLELASFQFGWLINSGIYTGGTLSLTYSNVGSGLITSQQLTGAPSIAATVAGYPGKTLIRQAGKIPPGAGNGTIISTTGPGTLLTHYTLTSTVPFTSESTPNFVFNPSTAITPLYATRVAVYIGVTNTQLVVTPGTNAIICCNPNLNHCLGSPPIPYTVTGSGSYCQGDDGLAVGLTGSQFGVDYMISPGGQIVAGTGSAITFGTRSAGTYTVAGNGSVPGICGSSQMAGSAVITETPLVTPTFDALGPYCQNATAGALLPTSLNSITGTWSPPVISTAATGGFVYVFTPGTGQCASLAYMNLTITVPVAPLFTQLGPYCVGATPGELIPNYNGISGTWSPATISTAIPGITTYTFTPDAIFCATTVTMDVVVADANLAPAFTQLGPYCVGAIPDPLPGTSLNSITGTWVPATIATAVEGTTVYTFTPALGQCATTSSMTINITPAATAYAGPDATICQGSAFTVSQATVMNATGIIWTHNGLGTLSGSTTLNPTYIPANGEEGEVQLTLTGFSAILCPDAVNAMTIFISAQLQASVGINASANPVSTNTPVNFTATPSNGGSPSFQWYVNSIPAGTGLPTFTYVPVNGDQVYVVMTSGLPCITNNPATSNVIQMNVYTPNPTAFSLTVQNLAQTSPNTLEFDVYLLDTDSNEPFEIASFQFGWLINSGIYTGGALSLTYNNANSGLIAAQQLTATPSIVSTVAGYPGQTLIRQAGKVPPGAGNGTIISQVAPGTLLTHYALTSTVPFSTNSTANFIFNPSTALTPLYATRILEYIDGVNTQVTVTPGTNALICCNPILNPDNSPVAFAVTGGGAYCNGGSGLSVGIANSEIDVSYQLYKDAVAIGVQVPGTGLSLSFGDQTVGTYTITGTNSIGTTSMTGSAIITEASAINLDPSISNETCGLNNGVINVTVTGSVPGYTFIWSNGETTEDISNLGAGNYSLTVMDAIGCSATGNFIILSVTTVPASVSITTSSTNVATGTPATFTATAQYGGTPIYQWYVNSIPAGTGLSTFTYVPVNGDQVYVVMTSGLPCATNNPAISNVIQMVVYTPNPTAFQLSVQNMTQLTSKTLEFDVYLLDTDLNEPFELASLQLGFLLNSGIYTGGTFSGVINNSNSGLIPAQQFTAAVSIVTAVSGYPGQTLVRLAGKVPPGAGNGTIISQVGFGTLLTHFTFTSTVDFVANSLPNLIFNSSTAITPLYATRVAQYIGSVNTQLTVTPGTNALVCCNPTLNSTVSSHESQWTGAISNDWFVSANWGFGVPGDQTNVTIPGGLTNYPTLTSPTSCASITINNGGSFIGAEFLTVGISTVKCDLVNTQYHYLSSPVNSATFGNVFSGSLTTWAKKWNPLSNGWVWQTSLNSFAIGAGYAATTSTPTKTANFVGQLNKVDATSTLSNANGGWNLLGNPFQSAIDWDNVIRGAGVSPVVKVWNGTTYLDYSATLQTGSFDGFIPAENGFFVSTTVNNDFVTVPLAARTHGMPSIFYKNTVSDLLRIDVSGNDLQDATFIHFNTEATSGYDAQFDGVKLWGEDYCPQVYSITSGQVLSINELPMIGNETVDLGFKCNTDGSYSLTASGMDNFDASTPILLEDTKLNTTQDLRSKPVYNFNYVEGDNENRFKLLFKSENAAAGDISVYSYDHDVIICNNSGLSGEVWILDMTGRLLKHDNLTSQLKTIIPIHVSIGSYLVKVVTDRSSVNQKVFIR